MNDFKTFLIPYDFSDGADAALVAGLDLARRLGADCHLVHVMHSTTYGTAPAPGAGMAAPAIPAPGPDRLEMRESALASLEGVIAKVEDPPGRLVACVVEDSNVAGALGDMAAKLEADLIVMGTRGRTGLARMFLGSVAERTLRIASCPVLAVPAPSS
ncbi:MAG: universal stress protein [Myxococcota bacterium]